MGASDMTAQAADLVAATSGGPHACHAFDKEIVTGAFVEAVKDGICKHAECRHGGRRGLGDHHKTRGVMTHDGEDDGDPEQ